MASAKMQMQVYTATSTTHELRKVWCAGEDGPAQDQRQEGYRYAKDFLYEGHDVPTLAEFCDLLNRLSDAPRTALVLGKPKAARGSRTSLDFENEASPWFIVDLDSVEHDGSPEDVIVWAMPFLRGQAFLYAFSASSGVKSGHRLRVIFEIEPMSLDLMRVHAEQMNTDLAIRIGLARKWIDYSIYKPAQLVFTARPKLEGLDDPHPVRAHLVEGDAEPVSLPALPEMVDVEERAATNRGQPPTLRWDTAARNNSAFDFMVGYRTAFPHATWAECWNALSAEYDRLGITTADRMEGRREDFGREWVKQGFHKVRGARRSRKAFKQSHNPVPLAEAERQLDEVMTRAICERDKPRLTCIRVDAGTGKSTVAMRKLGVEKRYADSIGMVFMADYYVPHHRLSDELVRRAEDEGLDTFVEYGRQQVVGDRRVCEKHEAAQKLQGVVPDLPKAICENEEAICEFRHVCIWWQQKELSLTADVRIRSHEYLPIQPSGAPGPKRMVDVSIIDEDPVSSFLHNGYVEVKDLCDVTRHGRGEWRLKLHQVIKDGLTLEALAKAGIDAEVCSEMIKAEESLRREVGVSPSMSQSESVKAAGDFDQKWFRYASFWRRLRDCIVHGSLNRVRVSTDKKAIITNWADVVKAIPSDGDGRVTVTTVIMSATMKRSMIEQFFVIDEWLDIEVEKHPSAEVIQADLKGSMASLLYGEGDRAETYRETDKDKKAAAEKLRADVARVTEGKPLLTYKALADMMPVAGWFNAVEGLNDWDGQDVAVLGRPLPPPQEIEDMARAIFQNGDPIQTVGAWYPKKPIARVGPGMAYCERHPDSRVEDVRWTVCEGAIMQAVARTRYVRRPCKVLLLSETVLPLEVDKVVSFSDLLPEVVEYRDAPVRTAGVKLAGRLFRKFAGASRTKVTDGLGDIEAWAREKEARFVEVRCEGDRQWSRTWVGMDGWAWLERVGVVAYRYPQLRKDDRADRVKLYLDLDEHVSEISALREAFDREPWLDEDGDEARAIEAEIEELEREYGLTEDTSVRARLDELEKRRKEIIDPTSVGGAIWINEHLFDMEQLDRAGRFEAHGRWALRTDC